MNSMSHARPGPSRTLAPDVAKPPFRDDLKLAGALGLVAALATAALFPYLMQIMPEALAKLPIPLALVVPLQALQAGVLLGLLSLAGLRMAPRANLRLPWLRAWVTRQPLPRFPWLLSLVAGVATALVLVSLTTLIDPLLPPPLHGATTTQPAVTALAGLLASFYGGIGEELQLRLFLMTLVVWVFARLGKRAPSPMVYWIAIVTAALLFGAGHLPAAAQVWPLDEMVVFRTLLLNGIAGLVFGWLYWKRGLETAMVAHFGADLVLHVAMPLLAPWFA